MVLIACNSTPKPIEGQPVSVENTGLNFGDQTPPPGSGLLDNADHEVVVREALGADKYTYLRVKEGAEEFWIAVAKQDVKVGGNYLLRGGLLAQNFWSQELDRTFETLYLVSNFKSVDGEAVAETHDQVEPKKATSGQQEKLTPAPGAIPIAELVKHLSQYDGKIVKVTGKVVKVNSMIMGMNWVHLQDGSEGNPDLTVTTLEQVQTGKIVTMEGKIAVDRDFGSGYRYDYIMENAVVK